MSQPANSHIVEILGGDRIEAFREGDRWVLTGIMCAECRSLLAAGVRTGADPALWELPAGNSHSALLVRELLLKIRGEWKFPYADLELCHCRAIPAAAVDQAILCGAHTPETVSAISSASTACGTCRPDVQAILAYRLTG